MNRKTKSYYPRLFHRETLIRGQEVGREKGIDIGKIVIAEDSEKISKEIMVETGRTIEVKEKMNMSLKSLRQHLRSKTQPKVT